MKILFTADWHIKLGQRKVPAKWQINRFHMLVDELNKVEADLHIIGGDIFDVPDPSAEEFELYYDIISKLTHKTIIYSGNHEAITKSRGVLHTVAKETTRCNPLVSVVFGGYRTPDLDIIDFYELHKKWEPQESKLCFTHVRAELPAHMKSKPEIELSKFDIYDLVVAGDLHDYKMSQQTEAGTPIMYPGSPLSTSFHREIPEKANGYFIVDTELLTTEWHDLGHLPHLLRKKVTSEDEMIEDPYHRVVYEIEGDLGDLGKVNNSELLDKKINNKVSKDAKLDLRDLKLTEEVALYLEEVEGMPEDKVSRCIARLDSEVKTTDI